MKKTTISLLIIMFASFTLTKAQTEKRPAAFINSAEELITTHSERSTINVLIEADEEQLSEIKRKADDFESLSEIIVEDKGSDKHLVSFYFRLETNIDYVNKFFMHCGIKYYVYNEEVFEMNSLRYKLAKEQE